ncbi:MAG: TRAP transporter large permease subunit, partial [Marinobacter sp.]
AEALGINMLWFAILVAMNLQTSFLTPPFGFALFYLKGVAPPNVKTTDIYKGIIPYILIQILVLALIVVFPEWFGMSSTY